MTPIAYQITWTAYGTWLQGDDRGWVQSGVPGIQEPDPVVRKSCESRLSQQICLFDDDQRQIIIQTIHDHCRMRGWELHAVNVLTNHVHVVVTADRAPEDVMNQLKAWTARRLSDHAGYTETIAKKAGRHKWWTEHGSTKWINDPQYFANAVHYVADGQ